MAVFQIGSRLLAGDPYQVAHGVVDGEQVEALWLIHILRCRRIESGRAKVVLVRCNNKKAVNIHSKCT